MYKVYFNDRILLLSREPDRLQKYTIFCKFDNPGKLYDTIDIFQKDKSIISMNIFGSDIRFIWTSFLAYFVNVGAAGGLVRHPSGRYLIIIRNGMADLPKGHIEKGESPPNCALREVAEECGIKGHSIVKELPMTYHTYPLKDKTALKMNHWYLMDYTGKITGSPQTEEGITEIKWLLPEELYSIRNNIWPSLTGLIDTASNDQITG